MRLTRYTDYSLRVLIYLGLQNDGRVTIRQISDAYKISRNHLMKVVSNLSRRGYIEAQRGPGGGIRLARPANEIILSKVICDMEEDLNMAECFSPTGRCTISAVCRLQGFLKKALQAYLESLQAITLEELLHPSKELRRLLKI